MSDEPQGDTFYDHLLQVDAIIEEMYEMGDISVEEGAEAIVNIMEELAGGYYE